MPCKGVGKERSNNEKKKRLKGPRDEVHLFTKGKRIVPRPVVEGPKRNKVSKLWGSSFRPKRLVSGEKVESRNLRGSFLRGQKEHLRGGVSSLLGVNSTKKTGEKFPDGEVSKKGLERSPPEGNCPLIGKTQAGGEIRKERGT